MPKVSGSCLCGAVRYESPAEPKGASICHCTHCQKVSGGAFSVNVLVPRASLVWTGEAAATYVDTGESGRKLKRKFCARCGSSLASEPDGMPDITVLKAGTLDARSWVSPGTHIWCASKQPWVEVPAGVSKFDKGRA